MVKLLIGRKGSGKTNKMIELANAKVVDAKGSVVFINKNARLTYDLKHAIRVVCMEEYEGITNTDEYIGFVCGIISSDHDIEAIYIDSILKFADISIENLPAFLDRLAAMSDKFGMDFVVSVSADAAELGNVATKFEVLN